MNVTIYPSHPSGTVAAPPSKSMTHRLLISTGLARGESTVRGVALSGDVAATVDCLRALGAKVALENGAAFVRGVDPARAESAVLACRESGSTLRFFVPLCALSGREMTLTGAESLFRRPMDVYEKIFRERGLPFSPDARRLTLRGPLPPGEFRLAGDVSSQFVSGLLFALPLLSGDSVISLLPPVESRAYIDLTLSALAAFGVRAFWRDELTLSVPGSQRFQARDVTVEGDWSAAANFLALGARVTGLDPESLQSDRISEAYFAALDAGRAVLDISGCPDLGPVLMVYAAARSGCVLTGTRRLAFKESDRGSAMASELGKCGVTVTVGENEIAVSGSLTAPGEPLCGHGDHRVVMALAVLCAITGGTVCGTEAVNKSFPDFFERLRALGVGMEFREQP